jgi:phospholipase C
MNERVLLLPIAAAVVAGSNNMLDAASIDDVAHVVVIYAENRSFDKLYGSFPGVRFLAGDA